MAWPAVKAHYAQDEFMDRIQRLNWIWRPPHIMIHNTSAPTMAQWIKTAREDIEAGRVPGITRINSLAHYFQSVRGWTASGTCSKSCRSTG